MLHINRVTLLGHAGRDPELRTLPEGGRTAGFSLATTRRWTGRDGQPAEATEWHRIVVFGGAVEPVEKLVRKGAAVLVEGRLAVRDYTDAKGKERQVTEIVVAGPQGMVNVLSPKPKAEAETARRRRNPDRRGRAAVWRSEAAAPVSALSPVRRPRP